MLTSSASRRFFRSSKLWKHHRFGCCQATSGGLRQHGSKVWSEKNIEANGIDFQVSIYNPPDILDEMSLRPVLCIPGALGTGPSDFHHLLEGGLGSEFQVIALDPRGLGGSASNTERDYPSDFYLRDALDAAAVMSELGHDKFHVMGWSDGANSAIHLAAHPSTRHAVERLVVWGGNAFVTQEDVDSWESIRSIENWSRRMRDEKAALHGGPERLQALNERATDGWINMYRNPKVGGDICLKVLHQVFCPTLVLHGMKDVICDISHARYISRQIANSELSIFPEGKHNLHQRYADEFHQIVRSFLLDDDLDRRDDTEDPIIDEIAYAFMGSKALSTALRAGIFDAIDSSSKFSGNAAFSQIEKQSTIKGERLHTLLSACVALKLIRRYVRDGEDKFSLPKASADQLVRNSKRYWGDYISGQVDGQFYNRLVDLEEIMRTGTSATSGYEAWFDSDPEAAKRYTEAQHNGSLATAYALHKRLPYLAKKFPKMRMLDVGGGSGAFSIATAKILPGSECVILDLPNVTKVADDIIAKESDQSVQSRLSTLSMSASQPDQWGDLVEDESFDVVLMSYVSGSIPAGALPGLYRNALRALRPGGVVVIHDFFVDNKGDGPQNAALWALAHVSVNPEGMGLRPNRIVDLLTSEGFIAPKVDDLIPGATQVIVASKPCA